MKTIILCAVVLLSACGDGVPKVNDPSRPVDASGKPISGTEFIQKYCQGKTQSETCGAVYRASKKASVVGALPPGY